MITADEMIGKQWCLRVERRVAEETRRQLIAEGSLDRRYKIRTEGEEILLPITDDRAGAPQEEFELVAAPAELPRHEMIGGIAIMQDDDPEQAFLILKERPNIHTVLFSESAVEGEYRTRRFHLLAGRDTTRTEYQEYGHTLMIDLAGAYFSARLSEERQRIRGMMQEGERVLDMFAGVGPFPVALADKASIIYASDINPSAVSLMIENLSRNRISNVLPILADAADLPSCIPGSFDRIIMNLPLSAEHFLPGAFMLCRPGGVIHLYALVSREGEYLDLIRSHQPKEVTERFVRSYSPGRYHTVYEIRT